MRMSLRVLSPVFAAFLCAVAVPAPAHATALGVVLDQGSFGATIPSGFTGSSDFASCEYQRYANVDNDHYQHLYADLNDTCASHTNGAPGFGDVSIYQRFNVNGGA